MWHIYAMEYYSAVTKKKYCATCRDVDGPRDWCTQEWSQRKKNKSILTYICGIKKMVQMNIFAK